MEFISSSDKPNVGSISWFDQTIPDAERIKEFYEEGIRWTIEPVAMGDYENFSINSPETGDRMAGTVPSTTRVELWFRCLSRRSP